MTSTRSKPGPARSRESSTPDDGEALVKSIMRTATLVSRIATSTKPQWLIQSDLTLGQVKALMLLSEKGSHTVGAISRQLGVGEPTTSGIVDRLVRSGYAERAEDPFDRRRCLVRLGKAGKRLMEERAQLRLERVRALVDRLGKSDRRALLRGLEAIISAVNSMQSGGRTDG